MSGIAQCISKTSFNTLHSLSLSCRTKRPSRTQRCKEAAWALQCYSRPKAPNEGGMRQVKVIEKRRYCGTSPNHCGPLSLGYMHLRTHMVSTPSRRSEFRPRIEQVGGESRRSDTIGRSATPYGAYRTLSPLGAEVSVSAEEEG